MDLIRQYAAARAEFLRRIAAALAADERFAAGWLGGSYGRGEADALSDLDLVLVATGRAAETLCARPWIVAGGTTEARLELFTRFGEIVAVHENHRNAPPGSTFTFTMYRGSGLMVDWTLVPEAGAARSAGTLLLFDRVGVRVDGGPSPLTGTQQAEALRERLAFLTMMATVTAKCLARGDRVEALTLLDGLYRVVAEIEALATGSSPAYRRGSAAPALLDPAEQAAAIRGLLSRAQAAVSDLEGEQGLQLLPLAELDAWLRMADGARGR